MPANPRGTVADAELKFPVRIVKVPGGGIGTRYKPMTDWLDENCSLRGWSITPAGARGIANDAVAIYMSGPSCAVGFVARWLVPGDPPGFYEFRLDEPERRVPALHHSTPGRRKA